jgi:hypothetical protein
MDRKPITLVAIMIADEIATFTDQSGHFYFQLTTSNRKVTLSFQESTHRQVEVTVDIQHSSSSEVVVIMEHIETIQRINRLQDGLFVQLNDQEVVRTHGVNVSLSMPPNSLLTRHAFDNYIGPGHVLHSLYHTGVKPDFTSTGLKQMIYRDSKGAEFTIQSFLIGSLEIVNDMGHPLTLKQGRVLTLSISLKFEGLILKDQLSNIHLFTYIDSESRWLDFGKLVIASIASSPDGLETWVIFIGKLRILGSLWAIGLPIRVSCYIKTRVLQSETDQELLGQTVSLEQSDQSFKRPTYYHYSTPTIAGTGACLKSVCALGGLISLTDINTGADYIVSEATPPSVSTGVVMGNSDQIMFYLLDKSQIGDSGETPYYLTEEACMQSSQAKPGYFEFLQNSSSPSIVIPSLLHVSPLHNIEAVSNSDVPKEYCFVKVAIYDCALYSDVKALSYNSEDHSVLISMHTDVAVPLSAEESRQALTGYACQSHSVARLRASCVEYTCGSEVHVTVNSRQSNSDTTMNLEPKSCRYWSSNSNVLWSLHPSSNMKIFHFMDEAEKYDSGLYRSSTNRHLALMQCKSGDIEEPSNVIDPYKGTAVTFTCQY